MSGPNLVFASWVGQNGDPWLAVEGGVTCAGDRTCCGRTRRHGVVTVIGAFTLEAAHGNLKPIVEFDKFHYLLT